MSEETEPIEEGANELKIYHLNELSYDIEKERNQLDTLHFILHCLQASQCNDKTLASGEQMIEPVFTVKEQKQLREKIMEILAKIK